MFANRGRYHAMVNAGVNNAMQRRLIQSVYDNANTDPTWSRTLPEIYERLAKRSGQEHNAKLTELRKKLKDKLKEEKNKWVNKQLLRVYGEGYRQDPSYKSLKEEREKAYNRYLELQNKIRRMPKSGTNWNANQRKIVSEYLKLKFNHKIGLNTLLEQNMREDRSKPPNPTRNTIEQQRSKAGGLIGFGQYVSEPSGHNIAMRRFALKHKKTGNYTQDNLNALESLKKYALPVHTERYIKLMSKANPSEDDIQQLKAFNTEESLKNYAKLFKRLDEGKRKELLGRLAQAANKQAMRAELAQYGMHVNSLNDNLGLNGNRRQAPETVHVRSGNSQGTASPPPAQGSTFARRWTSSHRSQGGSLGSHAATASTSRTNMTTMSDESVVLTTLGIEPENHAPEAEDILIQADKAHACIRKTGRTSADLIVTTGGRVQTQINAMKWMGPNTWKAFDRKSRREFFVRRMRFSGEDELVAMVELANTTDIPFFTRVLAAARCKRKYYVVFTQAFDMTLKQWFNMPDRKGVQPSEYVSSLLQIMVALAAVHSQNLVHGAIKASNIVVKPSPERRKSRWNMLVGGTLLEISQTTGTFALNNLVRAKAFESRRTVRPPPCEVRDVLRIFASGRGVSSELYNGTKVLYMLARRGQMDAPTFLQDPEVLQQLQEMSRLALRVNPRTNSSNSRNNPPVQVLHTGYRPYEGIADCSKQGSGIPTATSLRMMARNIKHRLDIKSQARNRFGI